MKIFGTKMPFNDDAELTELSEIAFQAEPSQIKKVAAFLQTCAELMEKHGDAFGHEHFRDRCPEWNEDRPDIIVCKT